MECTIHCKPTNMKSSIEIYYAYVMLYYEILDILIYRKDVIDILLRPSIVNKLRDIILIFHT